MLLVFDIGNSNIVMGTYEGKKLLRHWRISTDRQKTGDEYGMLINSLFGILQVVFLLLSQLFWLLLILALTKCCKACLLAFQLT